MCAIVQVLQILSNLFAEYSVVCDVFYMFLTVHCETITRRNKYLIIRRPSTRVGTLIVATIYLQLIQNRYMFRSFTVLQCSHQHCIQPVASDVEVVGYL